MFTGIIEQLGTITAVSQEGENYHYTIQAELTPELKIDQSVAHDGVCLTVVSIEGNCYVVTAIKETMEKTALRSWKAGRKVNLERCMQMNGRLDGHIVQGHVDQTAVVTEIEDQDGSWKYTFDLGEATKLIVEKGSICLNGTSLTAFDVKDSEVSVAIIPYTYEHTSFHQLAVGSVINVEFDILGKYVEKMMVR